MKKVKKTNKKENKKKLQIQPGAYEVHIQKQQVAQKQRCGRVVFHKVQGHHRPLPRKEA
jgi:hypothetical protein